MPPFGSARGRRLRALALLTCLLSLLVVAVSATLRLSGAGLGCADWPGCYGAILAGVPHAPWEGARLLHRIVATLALLAGIEAKAGALMAAAREAVRVAGEAGFGQ